MVHVNIAESDVVDNAAADRAYRHPDSARIDPFKKHVL